MSLSRVVASTPFAIFVTVLIFVLMFGLIKMPANSNTVIDEQVLSEPVRLPPEKMPPPENTAETIVTEKDRPTRPVDPRVMPPEKLSRPDPSTFAGTKPSPVVPTGTMLSSTDMGGVPMITAAPMYPTSCQSQGVEGNAVVEFDILGSGQVVNAKVISATNKCFEKSALRAIENWRYQPLIGQEDKVIKRGIQQTFIFEITV